MSWKGHTFEAKDAPRSMRNKSADAVRDWCAAQTERYKIVATHPVKGPLIAEELRQRALNDLSPKARRLAGAMLSMDAATRREILGLFDADGALKNIYPAA